MGLDPYCTGFLYDFEVRSSVITEGLIISGLSMPPEANADTSLAVEDGESVAVVYAGDHGGEFSGSQTRNCEDAG